MAEQVLAGSTDPTDEDDETLNPDTLPSSYDPSGQCPRCERVSNFGVMATDDIEWRTDFGRKQAVQQCVRLRCHGCGNETVVIEQYRSGDGWSPLLWFPKPGHLSDTTDVPDAIAGAFDEGARCISVEASNAAVAMFRNALAQIVQDKGSEDAKKAKTLNDAVKQMVVDRTLHDGFKKFADHVRTVGNAGAHQETWAEVPIEQAQELREFVKHLIDTLYVQPGRLDRAIPPKKRSTQPAPSSP